MYALHFLLYLFQPVNRNHIYTLRKSIKNVQAGNQLRGGCDLDHLREVLVKIDATFRNVSISCISSLIH